MQRPAGTFRWLIPALLVASGAIPARAADATPEGIEFFEKKIRPLLTENCFRCHSHEGKHKANLFLDSRTSMLKGGDNGPALQPGEPDKSLLVKPFATTATSRCRRTANCPIRRLLI
jgi:hypothetical protein